MSKKLNRVGEKYLTNEGYWITIIEYFNRLNCTIQFDNGIIFKNIQLSSIKIGAIKNPYHKSVYGIGYVGQGKYKTNEDGKPTKIYYIWKAILERCYSEKKQKSSPTYKGCSVDERWHNFQNFGVWYEENYKPYMQGWHLDKDILFKGNKIYSPETCCFVPNEINIQFTKFKGDLPTGITYRRNKFQAQISIKGILFYLGIFDTIEEAFLTYKIAKEKHIKEVAEKWKSLISVEIYSILINYEVEKHYL